MELIFDVLFLLVAAGGGASAVCLVLWLRAAPTRIVVTSVDERFARETLARLHDLTRSVAAEVDQHAECVQEINAQLTNDDNDEAAVLDAVAQLIDANRKMQRQLDSAEERLQSQAIQIESHAADARTDALTQVANRRALNDELTRCVADFERRGTPTTLMLIDVDHFKVLNDSYGHQTGDDVLRTVARVIRQAVSDVGLVARYGGEEFAVVFAGLSAEAAIPYGERARQAVGKLPAMVNGREIRVTVSAGLAMLLPKNTDAELIGRADAALYASKNAGRDCGHFHDGERCQRMVLEEESVAEKPFQVGEVIGDEWLYEAEIATQTLFREPIPNISNRPAFFDDLIRRLAHWRRGHTPLTLLLVQVDEFPSLAEKYGSTSTEAVLRIAAQLINAVMRDMDHVARLGEDTFALLLPGAALSNGVAIAERLRHAVERCRLPRRAGISRFTVSIGVVEASGGDDLRHILERGRTTLQTAIGEGRNRVVGGDAETNAVGRVVSQGRA